MMQVQSRSQKSLSRTQLIYSRGPAICNTSALFLGATLLTSARGQIEPERSLSI
jgi:hypothetical protein